MEDELDIFCQRVLNACRRRLLLPKDSYFSFRDLIVKTDNVTIISSVPTSYHEKFMYKRGFQHSGSAKSNVSISLKRYRGLPFEDLVDKSVEISLLRELKHSNIPDFYGAGVMDSFSEVPKIMLVLEESVMCTLKQVIDQPSILLEAFGGAAAECVVELSAAAGAGSKEGESVGSKETEVAARVEFESMRAVPWRLRMQLLHGLAAALNFLHHRGFILGRLMASDVAVTPEWTAKLCGLSHCCHVNSPLKLPTLLRSMSAVESSNTRAKNERLQISASRVVIGKDNAAAASDGGERARGVGGLPDATSACPELFLALPTCSFPVDIFSFGILMAQVVSGERPQCNPNLDLGAELGSGSAERHLVHDIVEKIEAKERSSVDLQLSDRLHLLSSNMQTALRAVQHSSVGPSPIEIEALALVCTEVDPCARPTSELCEEELAGLVAALGGDPTAGRNRFQTDSTVHDRAQHLTSEPASEELTQCTDAAVGEGEREREKGRENEAMMLAVLREQVLQLSRENVGLREKVKTAEILFCTSKKRCAPTDPTTAITHMNMPDNTPVERSVSAKTDVGKPTLVSAPSNPSGSMFIGRLTTAGDLSSLSSAEEEVEVGRLPVAEHKDTRNRIARLLMAAGDSESGQAEGGLQYEDDDLDDDRNGYSDSESSSGFLTAAEEEDSDSLNSGERGEPIEGEKRSISAEGNVRKRYAHNQKKISDWPDSPAAATDQAVAPIMPSSRRYAFDTHALTTSATSSTCNSAAVDAGGRAPAASERRDVIPEAIYLQRNSPSVNPFDEIFEELRNQSSIEDNFRHSGADHACFAVAEDREQQHHFAVDAHSRGSSGRSESRHVFQEPDKYNYIEEDREKTSARAVGPGIVPGKSISDQYLAAPADSVDVQIIEEIEEQCEEEGEDLLSTRKGSILSRPDAEGDVLMNFSTQDTILTSFSVLRQTIRAKQAAYSEGTSSGGGERGGRSFSLNLSESISDAPHESLAVCRSETAPDSGIDQWNGECQKASPYTKPLPAAPGPSSSNTYKSFGSGGSSGASRSSRSSQSRASTEAASLASYSRRRDLSRALESFMEAMADCDAVSASAGDLVRNIDRSMEEINHAQYQLPNQPALPSCPPYTPPPPPAMPRPLPAVPPPPIPCIPFSHTPSPPPSLPASSNSSFPAGSPSMHIKDPSDPESSKPAYRLTRAAASGTKEYAGSNGVFENKDYDRESVKQQSDRLRELDEGNSFVDPPHSNLVIDRRQSLDPASSSSGSLPIASALGGATTEAADGDGRKDRTGRYPGYAMICGVSRERGRMAGPVVEEVKGGTRVAVSAAAAAAAAKNAFASPQRLNSQSNVYSEPLGHQNHGNISGNEGAKAGVYGVHVEENSGDRSGAYFPPRESFEKRGKYRAPPPAAASALHHLSPLSHHSSPRRRHFPPSSSSTLQYTSQRFFPQNLDAAATWTGNRLPHARIGTVRDRMLPSPPSSPLTSSLPPSPLARVDRLADKLKRFSR